MNLRFWPVVVLGVLSIPCSPAQGPSPPRTEIDISPGALAREIARAERQKEIPSDLREQIVNKYKEALKASDRSEFYSSERLRYDQFGEEVEGSVKEVRSELQKLDSQRGTRATIPARTDQLRQILTEAQAELLARREALSDIERFARQRAQRRTEIANRIAAVNQEIIRINEAQLPTNPGSDGSIARATYLAVLASRKAAQNEIQALRAEVGSYDDRAELFPLWRDLAEKRVSSAARTVQELETALLLRTAAESEAFRKRVQRECQDGVKLFPSIRPLTEEIQDLAQLLAAPHGVQAEADVARHDMERVRAHLVQLRRIVQSTRRKFEAAGANEDASRWFPDISSSMPTTSALRRSVRARQVRITEIQREIASLENTRTKHGDIESEVSTILIRLNIVRSSMTPDFEARLQHLFYTRRDLQDGLLASYSRALSALSELDSVARSLLLEQEQLGEYVRERILWTRSVPGALLPAWPDVQAAANWIFFNPEWSEIFARFRLKMNLSPASFLTILVLIALPFIFRLRLIRQLTRAGAVSYGSNASFYPTAQALLLTLLLAAPVPALLLSMSWLLLSASEAHIAINIGGALRDVGILAFAIGFLIEMTRPGGFAERHFAWPSELAGRTRSAMRFSMITFLPAVFVCLAFGRDITRYIGPREQVAAANSLGRIAFLVAVVAAFMATYWLLSPRGAVVEVLSGRQFARHRSWLRYVWMPLFSSAQVAAGILALTGYYLTAFVLMRRVLETTLAAGVIFLFAALLGRWMTLKRVRITAQCPEHERESGDPGLIDPDRLDVQLADDQGKRLSRFVASALLLVSVFLIWSDLLPSLRVLERVKLLPTIGFISDQEMPSAMNSARSAPQQSSAREPGNAPSDQMSAPVPMPVALAAPPNVPGGLQTATSSNPRDFKESYVSLADVLKAILILVVTILLARDIPGPLQFLLRHPLPNGGDRNAIVTIVKYLIILIGLSAAARQFGLKWSQIQWLAAAFSFGIAFGLQEIFANFVSGIIILIERPMSIGDACRFGTQVGTVESIGLRSTRLRGVDRTIITIPNADFSKKEVVNYTRRDRRLIQSILHLRVQTTEDQLRILVVRLREMFLGHPKVLKDQTRVRFIGFGPSSLNVEIFIYVDCRLDNELFEIQEELFLQVIDTVKEAGTDFAYPVPRQDLAGAAEQGRTDTINTGVPVAVKEASV